MESMSAKSQVGNECRSICLQSPRASHQDPTQPRVMFPRHLLFQLGPLFSSGLNFDHNELVLTSHSDFTLIQGIFVYTTQFQGLKI